MARSESYEIPETGAVFTFGKSRFADNLSSHFFVRNDLVLEISCGDEHTALVCKSGRVFLFGKNDYGQLGLGHTKVVNKPSCLKYLKPFQSVHVACGKSHTIVSTACCKLFAFGCNSDGQLGVGDQDDRLMPQLVSTGLAGTNNIIMLSAGCHHSAFLTDKGDLYLWGNNVDGQCGNNSFKQFLTPQKIEFDQPINSMSCGYYHTAFISNAQVYTFGEEDNGKLGRLNTSTNNIPKKVEIEDSCVCVKCGGNHTLVHTTNGKVFAFGSNFSGQLGVGSLESEFVTPQLVKFPDENINVVNISCGESHSAFLTSCGTLYTCGDARHGKLCNENESTNFVSPTPVEMFNNYFCIFVSCGGCHTMVLAKVNPNKEKTLLPPLKVLSPAREPNVLTEKEREEERQSLDAVENPNELEQSDTESNTESIINCEAPQKEEIYQEIYESETKSIEKVNHEEESSDKLSKETDEINMVVYPKKSFKNLFTRVRKKKSELKILKQEKFSDEEIQKQCETTKNNQVSSKACIIL